MHLTLQIVDTCPRAVLYKTLFKRRTPVMLASENGAVESLLKLLWAAERLLGNSGYQAYIDEKDGRGSTALILAVKHGYGACFLGEAFPCYRLACSAVRQLGRGSKTYLAGTAALLSPSAALVTGPIAACRHAVCARLLLEDSADPLPANSKGDTALHLAAGRGHAACLDMLLRSWVRSPGSGEMVRAADALVSDGLGEERYIDTHNKTGLAALHLAVLGGSVESGGEGMLHPCSAITCMPGGCWRRWRACWTGLL